MSLVYRVYTGINAPVDYSAPALTTPALSAALPALAPGDALTAVVRAYDTVTGLEDPSSDARVSVRLDAAGADATARPAPPVGLTARGLAGGSARVSWGYPPSGGATGFRVYIGTPAPDYSAPAASAPAPPDPARPASVTLSGLTDGVVYAVAVRAWNAAGEEANANTAAVTGRSSGPAAVEPLPAEVIP